jgi:hypothetical protein
MIRGGEDSALERTFESFKQLYYHYLEVKAATESTKCLIPKKVDVMLDIRKSWEASEVRLFFVADVQRYLNRLEFPDRVILELYYILPEATFEYIARWFRQNGHKYIVPRRFYYRQHIQTRFYIVRRDAKKHFIDNGYIRREI